MNGLTQTVWRQSLLVLWHTAWFIIVIHLSKSVWQSCRTHCSAGSMYCSEAKTSINLCEHAVINLFNTLHFGQWRNLNNMTDMKRYDFDIPSQHLLFFYFEFIHRALYTNVGNHMLLYHWNGTICFSGCLFQWLTLVQGSMLTFSFRR